MLQSAKEIRRSYNQHDFGAIVQSGVMRQGRKCMLTFNYTNITTWDPLIKRVLKRYWGKEYCVTVKRVAQNIDECDDLDSWFNLMSDKVAKDEVINAVMEEMIEKYESVLVFHACRPMRIDDYYRHGIRTLTADEVQNTFHSIFASCSTREDRERVIENYQSESVVYVVLDDRHLVQHCGHYLVYGGEYLTSLIAKLPNLNEAMYEKLRQRGKATIFVCCLPFNILSDLNVLAEQLLVDHCCRIGNIYKCVALHGFTVTVRGGVSSESLVSHYHPARIHDPLKWKMWNDQAKLYEKNCHDSDI